MVSSLGKEKNKLPALCPLLEGFFVVVLQKVNHIFIIFKIKLYKE